MAEPRQPAAETPVQATAPDRLSLSTKLAYGLPNFAGMAMGVPVAIHMTKFYSDSIGVAVGFIALAQVLARALDAITDPLMGWLSDRTRSRWGRRRPYILVGAPLTAISMVALFAPPDGITPLMGAAWFTTAFMAYFFFHTVYFIPHYGLGPELTSDYHERSGLFAWRDGISLLGQAFAAASPAIFIAAIKAQGTEQAEAERIVFLWFAVGMSVLLVISYYWMCWRIPENPAFSARKPNPLVPGVRRALRNHPFRILLACYMMTTITSGGIGVLMPFYLRYALGITDWVEWMGVALLLGYGTGVVTLPVFVRLARQFGKRQVWILSFVLSFTCQALLTALPSFIYGDSAAPWVMFFFMIGGMAFSTGQFLGPSMQADVIDYDELYTGKRREGQYGALWSIVTKFAIIPSSAIPLAVLATLGFEPNVDQPEAVRWAIRLLYAGVPGTMMLAAIFIAVRYPIDERVHRATLEGIAAHARGEPATDPITGRSVDPPDDRGLDEDTGWFLDHFSVGELRRALAAGPRRVARLRLDTRVALAVSCLILLAAGAGAAALFDLADEPGIGVLTLVLMAGVALTGIGFHAVRIRAAAGRRAGEIAPDLVRRHLVITERLAHAGSVRGQDS